MTDMVLAVRITADGAQLVGQLSAAEVKALSLKGAMQQAATGTEQLGRAADSTARAQREAAKAAAELAAAERRAAREAEKAAQEQARSLARTRQGYQQLGFQAQDFFTQIAGGTSVIRAATLQGGQLAQALQIVAAEQGKTTGAMGRFAALLGGPWGIALGVALPILGLLTERLLSNADASDEATEAASQLAQYQQNLANYFDLATGRVRENSQALRENAAAAALAQQRQLQSRINDTRARVRDAVVNSGSFRASGTETIIGPDGTPFTQSTYTRDRSIQNAAIRSGGNVDAFQAALRSIYRAGGPSAEQALSISNDLASITIDARSASRQDRLIDAFASGNLPQEFRTPQSSRTGRNRTRAGGSDASGNRAFALAQQGERLLETVSQINDRWNEQPSLIDRSRQDLARLDDVLRVAERRRPGNLSEIKAQVEAARAAIETGLLRPFNDMVEASARQREQQMLVLQGREREAEVLSRVYRLQDQMGDVTAEQRAEIERIVAQEERINQLLEKRETIIGAYMASLGEFRGAITDLLSGGSIGDFGRSIRDNVRRLRAELLTENLFGNQLRDLEQRIRRETGLEGAVDLLGDQTREAANVITTFAGAVQAARGVLTGQPVVQPVVAQAAGSPADGGESDIVVTGRRTRAETGGRATLSSMRPDDYFRSVARIMTSPVVAMLQQIDETMGTRLAGRIGNVLEGAAAGYLQAGAVGGVLGAANSLGIGGKAGAAIGNAYDGAVQGAQNAQLLKSLGLNVSSTGASLGGAVGAELPIPGGALLGSVFGGILGGLFKKAPRAAAVITSATDDAVVTGNKQAARDAVGSVAQTVQAGLQQIAEALGGELGDFNVSIGSYKDYYRVSASGSSAVGDKKFAKRAGSDLLYDGKDAAEAMAAAIANAIADGGISGLSAAVQKALKSDTDIDKALKEALKVQQVELLLGGVGAEMERQFRAFETQAKERLRIATQYGFDIVDIEKRNAADRAKLVDQLLADRVGGLQDLLRQAKYGDLFEGSAADRRAVLISEIAQARAEADAGTDGAAQKLADLSRQLIETSREAFGTAGPEYASDRASAITAAEQVIALENERIRAAQEAATATRDAVVENNRLTNESNDLLAEIVARLGGLSGIAAAQAYSAATASLGDVVRSSSV